jgi:hypothetical protein
VKRARLEQAGGFTLPELAASMLIALVVCGAVVTLVNTTRRMAATNAEADDLQQRLRAALHAIGDELVNAGAGADRTALAGPLGTAFPPVAPYRRGQIGDDALAGVAFRSDAISLTFVSGSVAQAQVAGVANVGGLLHVELEPNCGAVVPVSVCGFVEDMRVVLFDASGAYDFLTVESVAGSEVTLSYLGPLSSTYASGAVLAQAVIHTYARRPDPETGVPQLTRYDGFLTERPVVDHLVGLSFEYSGEADPPRLRPGVQPGVGPGPWTSYGPPPPPIGVDVPASAWPAGENCLFTVVDGAHEPRLATLGAAGEVVPLDESVLTDGPWCPDGDAVRRWDADLLRVRRVRVRVRAEAVLRAVRGAAGALFQRPGAASAALTVVPDREGVLDIVPRNLLTRR